MTKPNLFKSEKEQYIIRAQRVAQDLLMRRDHITIEDVTLLCPLPSYLHRNTLGAVFKNSVFRSLGYTVARRPTARGHVIRIWTLAAEYYPTSMLERRRRGVEYGSD